MIGKNLKLQFSQWQRPSASSWHARPLRPPSPPPPGGCRGLPVTFRVSLNKGAQCLRRELQTVKETLQAMILQLQPAKEVGERESAASCATAGVPDAQA